jgi:glycosyltransferase involved in cell wall biosynthesis
MRRRNYSLIARACVRKLAQNHLDFDLIHAHFLELGFAGAALKDERGIPLIVTAHGSDVYDLPFRDDWHKGIAKYVLSKADQVITVSQFNAAKLSSLGVSPRKLHVIYNGYDARIFKPMPKQEARKRLALPLTKKILLSVGNLVDVKGHEYLVNAMSVVLKTRHDAILVIVGSGPLRARLFDKIKRLKLNDEILLVGRKQHDDLPIWINASDIFVLPSLSEGFPTVIPEALACGKPVVGTTVGGVPEALSDQNVGILVNPKDSMALADAILVALEKKWHTDIIINYAQQYSWGNLVRRILEIYHGL